MRVERWVGGANRLLRCLDESARIRVDRLRMTLLMHMKKGVSASPLRARRSEVLPRQIQLRVIDPV